jgi:hypothetical protein
MLAELKGTARQAFLIAKNYEVECAEFARTRKLKKHDHGLDALVAKFVSRKKQLLSTTYRRQQLEMSDIERCLEEPLHFLARFHEKVTMDITGAVDRAERAVSHGCKICLQYQSEYKTRESAHIRVDLATERTYMVLRSTLLCLANICTEIGKYYGKVTLSSMAKDLSHEYRKKDGARVASPRRRSLQEAQAHRRSSLKEVEMIPDRTFDMYDMHHMQERITNGRAQSAPLSSTRSPAFSNAIEGFSPHKRATSAGATEAGRDAKPSKIVQKRNKSKKKKKAKKKARAWGAGKTQPCNKRHQFDANAGDNDDESDNDGNDDEYGEDFDQETRNKIRSPSSDYEKDGFDLEESKVESKIGTASRSRSKQMSKSVSGSSDVNYSNGAFDADEADGARVDNDYEDDGPFDGSLRKAEDAYERSKSQSYEPVDSALQEHVQGRHEVVDTPVARKFHCAMCLQRVYRVPKYLPSLNNVDRQTYSYFRRRINAEEKDGKDFVFIPGEGQDPWSIAQWSQMQDHDFTRTRRPYCSWECAKRWSEANNPVSQKYYSELMIDLAAGRLVEI